MSELIPIQCPHCAGQIQAPNTPGTVLMCPLCRQRFTLGLPGGGPTVAPPPPMPPTPSGSFGGGWAPPAPGEPAAATRQMAEHLRATRPWVLFLGVLGFIACGLMLLSGLGMVLIGSQRPGRGQFGAFLGCFYVVLAVLYLFPAYLLFSYGSSIGNYLESRSAADLERALSAQKSFWKFVGILTIIVLAIGIVGGLMAAATGARMHGHYGSGPF